MGLHHHQLLVDDALHAHTHHQLDQRDILNIYIHDEATTLQLGGHQTLTLEHQPSSELFIRQTLDELDRLIELDLTEVSNPADAEIRIHAVSHHDGWKDNVVGQVLPDSDGWNLLWKSTGQDAALSDFDANTIIHELGHALGLSHPDGDGHDKRWSTDDTVMSYNASPDGWDKAFSTADRKALVHLWGEETQPSPATNPSPPDAPIKTESTTSTPGDVSHNLATEPSDWTLGAFSVLLQGNSTKTDRVTGTAGNDVLVFGEGRDRLKGASGADLFLIPGNQRFIHRSVDLITDFNSKAGDVISLVTAIPDTLDTVKFATAETKEQFFDLQNTDATVIYNKTNQKLFHNTIDSASSTGNDGSFAELQDINLQKAETKRDLKILSQTNAEIIYFQTKGQLFYDANGTEEGYGDGGLIAKLKGGPALTTDNLRLWTEPGV